MHFYMIKFPLVVDKKAKKSEEGMTEGISLMAEHNFVKGIFCISSFFMVQVTVVDYMMKVLAKTKYSDMYPDDPQMALKAFASFMGYFGQATNGISFLFSLFGTGFVIEKFGLTVTLIMFPSLLLVCTVIVWIWPTIWVVFAVMMVMKGMSYALNNPTKEIMYQVTSNNIKAKCKSWIDTFGQRSAKATGSIITNAFATDIVLLTNWGSGVGIVMSAFLIWVSDWMGRVFQRLQDNKEKVGEAPERAAALEMTKLQANSDDNTCGLAEEGQESGGK
jgi:AAA family ATP:ADP antiporter